MLVYERNIQTAISAQNMKVWINSMTISVTVNKNIAMKIRVFVNKLCLSLHYSRLHKLLFLLIICYYYYVLFLYHLT